MKKLNVLEGSAHLRINEVKTIDFSGDSAMSINKQITFIYIYMIGGQWEGLKGI